MQKVSVALLIIIASAIPAKAKHDPFPRHFHILDHRKVDYVAKHYASKEISKIAALEFGVLGRRFVSR